MTATHPVRTRWEPLASVLAVTGALVVLLAFYPGYMSQDSFSQLDQARTGVIGDNHPPLLVGFWVASEWLVEGPFVMLLGQVSLFWSGLHRLARQTFPDRPLRAAGVVLVGLYPPVLGILGTLWKDVWMAGFLLWAVALTLAFQRRGRRTTAAAALLSMAAAVSMRHNAAAAIVPFAIAVSYVVVQQRTSKASARRRSVTAAVAGLALAGVMVLATSVVTSRVVDLHGHFWQVVADYDLAAISVATQEDLFPEGRLREGAALEDVETAYSARSLLPLYRWACEQDTPVCRPLILQTREGAGDSDLGELRRAWVGAVADHPGAYLGHRLRVFGQLLGVTAEPVWAPYYSARFAQDLDLATPQAPLSSAVHTILETLIDGPIYWVWLYALGLLGTLGWVVRGNRRGAEVAAVTMLASSGSLYLLSYLPLAPSPDFRYSHWVVLVLMLSVAILVRRPRT